MRASGASELRKFSHYIYSKPAISFNILLILQIICRFTGTDKSLNVPTKLRKSNWGGASHYASVVFCRKSMTFCVNTVSRALLIIMAHHDTTNALQATGKQWENICVRASRASELGKLSHFHIQKLIFKVLVICRYIPLVILTFYYIMKDRAGKGREGDFENSCTVKTSFSCTLMAIIRG